MGIVLDRHRLIIAHNPHSSKAADVKERVFNRLDEAGYQYRIIEVQQASLEDNVARLAPQIKAGDIVLSAAGDGSAHAVFHSVLAANQPDVRLGFLAFGNFNDLPHMFNSTESLTDPVAFLEQAEEEMIWPIEVFINDRPLRNALLYASAGWTAKAAGQFDKPSVRKKITHGDAGLLKSYWRLGWYYFRSRRNSRLPKLSYNGKEYYMTDLIFANGPNVARLFKTGKQYYKKEVFFFRMLDVRSLIKNIPFLLNGLFGRIKGKELEKAEITFLERSDIILQCDGEVVTLKQPESLTVRKAKTGFVILKTK